MKSTVKNMTVRVRRIWRELDYAQRRSFELQTGVPSRAPRR